VQQHFRGHENRYVAFITFDQIEQDMNQLVRFLVIKTELLGR